MLDIIYEDNHLIAINKEPGTIVQAYKTGDTPLSETVAEYIAEKYKKAGKAFIGVVHRIDRPVTGVILFARTSKALERMNLQFKEREIEKTYWAVVRTKPPKLEDTLVHWLTKDGDANKVSYSTSETVGSLRSELTYKWIAEENGFYLLQVKPRLTPLLPLKNSFYFPHTSYSTKASRIFYFVFRIFYCFQIETLPNNLRISYFLCYSHPHYRTITH